MIIIPGVEPDAFVLTIIIGDETEVEMTLDGSARCDLSLLLEKLNSFGNKIKLKLIRCRRETDELIRLCSFGIMHFFVAPPVSNIVSSINDVNKGSGFADMLSKLKTNADTIDFKSKNNLSNDGNSAIVQNLETCSFCLKKEVLLPIDGFKICASCAKIELGRRISKGNNIPSDKRKAR